MASSQLEFNVERKQPELITPAEPTPYELKELSDIDDQDGVRLFLTAIFIYPPSTKTSMAAGKTDAASDIRRGLSNAMVYYYPFAGRIKEGPGRKLSVDCTGEGILFCEADADIRLDQLGDGDVLRPPFPSIDKLVLGAGSAILGAPLAYVQLTRFACGGFIVTSRFNHVMADAPGFCTFMTAAAELARGAAAPTTLPVWERERYRSRVPPRITFAHHEYMHDDPPPNPTNEPWSLHSVFFTKADVAALRAQLPADLRKAATSFEIITACIWRCRVAALQYAPDEVARLIIAVNSRTKFDPPLTGYYGNSLMLPAAVTEAGKLVGSDLRYAVELVREAKGRVTEEYVRSVADFLVLNGRVHFVVSNTYVVSDLRRVVDLSKMDWGWGKALYGGPADVGENVISFLAASKNSGGEEGAVVPFCLPDSAQGGFMSEVKKMVSFRPLEDTAAVLNRDGYMSRM